MVGCKHRARAGHILDVQARPQVIHIAGKKPDDNFYRLTLVEFVCRRMRRTREKDNAGDHCYNGPNDFTHIFSFLWFGLSLACGGHFPKSFFIRSMTSGGWTTVSFASFSNFSTQRFSVPPLAPLTRL